MPELPEVETMRRGILKVLGSTITKVEQTPCPRKPISIHPRIDRFNQRVCQRKIEDITRLGKRVILTLDSEEHIVFEPRMTGLVLIAAPPTPEHLRFRMQLDCPSIPEILFWDRRGLGKVELWNSTEYLQKKNDGSIGPDALQISFEDFAKTFASSTREIKVALLDQSKVAGIGNLYASEILHQAHVHPQTRCNRLTKKKWLKVYRSMIEVLELAIEYEGSTLSDGTYRNSLNKTGRYQNEHRVYKRENLECPSCKKDLIRRIVQAQRATFFCGKCQQIRGKSRKG